jgi:hypothetical protein
MLEIRDCRCNTCLTAHFLLIFATSTNNPLERCNMVKEFVETEYNIHEGNSIESTCIELLQLTRDVKLPLP